MPSRVPGATAARTRERRSVGPAAPAADVPEQGQDEQDDQDDDDEGHADPGSPMIAALKPVYCVSVIV
jgi:hypothetical protein